MPKISHNKVTVNQSADSVIKFLLDKEVMNATITIYDQYGRDPHGTHTFSEKEYAMDATRFSPVSFHYEIRIEGAAMLGEFVITKKKKNRAPCGFK